MAKRNVNIAVVLAVVVLSIAILANSMSKPVGRDERMYCTAGVLMSQGKMIYRDFSYASQLPYHPLLLATVYRVSGTNHYLLAGRMVSVVCDVLIVVCILGIYRRIFGRFAVSGGLLGLAGAVMYVFNPIVDYANGYAWNHDVVILCVAAAFWLYISLDLDGKLQWVRIAAIGGLLTFASCMRITTVLAESLFLAMLFGRAGDSWKARCKHVLPFLCAAGITLIWPVWVIAKAPEAFLLNLVKIPVLYGGWLTEIGFVHNKLALTADCLGKPGYLALIGIAGYLMIAVVICRRKIEITKGFHWLLASLLVAAFFAIAFVPPTMWRQYLAPPVPFLVIGLAYPLLYLKKLDDAHRFIRACILAGTYILVGICVFVAVGYNLILLKRIPLAFAPKEWTPIIKHNISEEIARKVPMPKKVLTLAPLLALEGGCDIYDELSAGAIIYRIADYLSAEERAVTNTVGPKGLSAMVNASPVSAVLLGVEAPHMAFLEKPLRAIVPPDWKREVLADGSVLYLRRLQFVNSSHN